MSKVPSSSECYAVLPRGEWFSLGDEIRSNFPALSTYERDSVLSKTLSRLRKEMGWGNVCRTGDPGRYRFMIMEGA